MELLIFVLGWRYICMEIAYNKKFTPFYRWNPTWVPYQVALAHIKYNSPTSHVKQQCWSPCYTWLRSPAIFPMMSNVISVHKKEEKWKRYPMMSHVISMHKKKEREKRWKKLKDQRESLPISKQSTCCLWRR